MATFAKWNKTAQTRKIQGAILKDLPHADFLSTRLSILGTPGPFVIDLLRPDRAQSEHRGNGHQDDIEKDAPVGKVVADQPH